MSEKSLVTEMQQVQLAIELIQLGARLQVVETETSLTRGRLIRLYKEVRGAPPPKGMLPFSTDWFVTWLPNIHSSLFYNIYRSMLEIGGHRIDAFIKAYRLYMEHASDADGERVLGLTRAWTLVRFVENGMLEQIRCSCCSGEFITHSYSPTQNYVCGICQPPSRAGKTLKKREIEPDNLDTLRPASQG
jgi:flagellar transcriptional activator FlhC